MKSITILITLTFIEVISGINCVSAFGYELNINFETNSLFQLSESKDENPLYENIKIENTDSVNLKLNKEELDSYLIQFPVAFSIDTLDTVVFDVFKSTMIGNQIEFPVSFHSDDYVYALDFALKYNNQNVEFDTVINMTNGLNYLYYLNPNDSTLRFTSYRLGQMQSDTTVVLLRFTSLTGSICFNDLNTITGYLNGDQCSNKVTDCDTTSTFSPFLQSETPILIYPIPAKGELFINAMESCKIQITDNKGDLYISKEIASPHSEYPVDISHLKNGIYFVRVTNKKYSFSEKIVIIN